jgi:hypothetical protein
MGTLDSQLRPQAQRSADAHASGGVDAWHHHDASEGAPQQEHLAQVNTQMLSKWFVGIFIFLVGVIVAMVVLFRHEVVVRRQAKVEIPLSVDYLRDRAAAEGQIAPSLTGAMDKVVSSYASGTLSLDNALPAGHPPVK